MKIKVNRNTLWCEIFVNELVSCGLTHAVLLPGSRNTPLTTAFARNSSLSVFSQIDERSGAFFALGIAKATGRPVALICTSGTAAAEFFPAVIEAYQQRTPLIVCTADRPVELLGCGANQTINQTNLYGSFARKYFDAGLPEVSNERLNHVKSLAKRAWFEALGSNAGPVHLNFPFRKPLESNSYTDEVEESLIASLNKKSGIENNIFSGLSTSRQLKDDFFSGLRNKNILFIAGPGSYGREFYCSLNELSLLLNAPVIADGLSGLRFSAQEQNNLLAGYEGYFRSREFIEAVKPEVLVMFGRTPTSKALEDFLSSSDAEKYLINSYGDWLDPYSSTSGVIVIEPEEFCRQFTDHIKKKSGDGKETTSGSLGVMELYRKAETISLSLKKEQIEQSDFPFEGRIVTEMFSSMNEPAVIMVSNSMPARDVDYFAPLASMGHTIFNNRGASGIDGIISTALGIAAVSKRPAVLLTGDLAFYYDLNGLLASKKYGISLTIVLVNNNGGGIFEMLPVSREEDIFNDYFITPHGLDFSSFVASYGGEFKSVSSWQEFSRAFKSSVEKTGLNVIEIKTDPKDSTLRRRKYWQSVAESFGR